MKSEGFRRRRRVVTALLLAALLSAAPSWAAEEPSPLPAQADALLAEIERIRVEYNALREQGKTLEGDERLVVVLQLRKLLMDYMRSVDKAVANVLAQEEQGLDARVYHKRTRAVLLRVDRTIAPFADRLRDEIAELRHRVAEEGQNEEFRDRIETLEELTDEVFRFYLRHVGHLADFGMPSRKSRKDLAARLEERAATLNGRLELASQRLADAVKESEAAPGDGALETAVRLRQEELDDVASSLWTTCDLMDEIGLKTASHRQALIKATGEVSADILDAEVILGLFEEAVEATRRWLERRGPPILTRLGLFVGILALFWLIGRLVRAAVARMMAGSNNISVLAQRIIVSTVSRAVVGVGFFVALSQVGVNVTALLAGLGIAGFIVGFALQDTLGNFASGAMILMYRPFDVGDVIRTAAASGQVDSMNLVSTTILTFDNQTLVVPNSKIWGDVIQNVTAQDKRRVDLSFGLSHDVDVERAEAIFAKVLSEHDAVLEDPAPAIRVNKLTDSAVEFVVRPWCKTDDYWGLFWDLNRAVKVALDREGIAFGVPRREVTARDPKPPAPPVRPSGQ